MEGHRLRVLTNRQLRKILRPKRDEVTGGWKKLLNDYPNKFRCYHPVVFQIEFIYIFSCDGLVKLRKTRATSGARDTCEGEAKRIAGKPYK